MKTPILDPAKVPDDWEEDIFGLVYPRSRWDRIWVGPVSGFEIRKDGVYVTENGVQRKAEWPEDIQIRTGFISGIGVEIARAAGIEPE